jgi:two-component system, OmpR family, sensor histidine kinase KdpD
MFPGLMRRGLAAPFALVAGFGALLALGTVAAGLHGRLTATGVLIFSAVIVGAMSFVAEPAAAVPLGVIGWLTAVGFSRPPYAELRPTGPLAAHAAVAIGVSALLAAGAGLLFRWSARRFTLVVVGIGSSGNGNGDRSSATSGHPGLSSAIDMRRRLLGLLLAALSLPLLTVLLTIGRRGVGLADDLLIYLVAVVAIAVIGGFWPAVVAAVAAFILLNWYFTPPLHTFTIEEPKNLLALLLFVTVAVAVSSVVHLAAQRAVLAARSREEAASLLALAQTVLGGADTPSAVLDHLAATLGGSAELRENVAGRWVPIAVSGSAPADAVSSRIDVRADLALLVAGQSGLVTPGLLAGFAAQAGAALDRERLRTQAAQAEALAEGNRMRTALLAAVSHDLRTPLASIKASVSSLRQTDVQWTIADETALLATIEQNADRLDALIGNLLDMSRLHTGSLEPFLRSITIDEVAPVALRGLDSSMKLEMDVPDGLPLVRADPGLLERVLANLFSNALRHSPPPAPAPLLRAFRVDDTVVLDVVDHGQGVPDALKPRIFEPFQRFDERSAGVGLGLAVAKGFAEAMGGSIAAVDTPGGGLTVRVTLPVAPVQARPVLGADQ